MPLGMLWILCEGCRWFKPPKLSSRECQYYFQMFLLIKANKKCFFLSLKTKPCGLPGFQVLQTALSIGRAYNFSSCSGTCEQSFLTCLAKQPAVNSSVKKKCKYLCWKQNDETADRLLMILLYKKMRARSACSSSPACCPSDCWGSSAR